MSFKKQLQYSVTTIIKAVFVHSSKKGIKRHKSMPENRLLCALNASESVKKREKNLVDTESTKNEDYDAHKTLKTTMPDLTKISKTIR